MDIQTKVSIIIPTYKDWLRLSLCLEALSQQTYVQEYFEIIVVNNKPNDKAPESLIVPDNCIIIEETKPGSYAARNAGLQIAKGEIIGFTDSDCIPDVDWIKNAVTFLTQNKAFRRIGGAVSVFSEKLKPTLVELYDIIYAFPQENYVKKGAVAVTANMFTYKELFEQVGEFTNALSGGDFEGGKRAESAGFHISYASDVIVMHPARKSLQALLIKSKRVGKGQVNYSKNKKISEVFPDIWRILYPKTWELKRISNGYQNISWFNKWSLFLIRHLVLWTKDFNRLWAELEK